MISTFTKFTSQYTFSRSALYTKKTFKLSMSMKPKFTYFATLNLPVWCCQHSCSTWQFTTKFTNITLGMHLHIIGPSFCFPPYCTVHVQCTEERDNFQILKGQCHEKSMTFYRMRYCCLNNGPRTGILVFDPLSKSYNFQTVAFYYVVYLLATVTSYCRTQIHKNSRGDATGPCYQIIRVRQVMARPFLRKTIGDQGLLPLADFLHWLL